MHEITFAFFMSRMVLWDMQSEVEIAKTRILGIPVHALNMDLAVSTVEGWAKARQARYVCVREVNGIMDAVEHPELKNIHENAGLITPDGMPLFWMLRLRGYSNTTRVCGRELMENVAQASVKSGLKHFFYGGAPGVAEKLKHTFETRFPGIQIVGTHTPPFRALTADEDAAVIEQIKTSGAHFVWVGISSPKQEYWMRDHVGKLPCVLFGVGAAFDFHSGARPVAPRWMQKTGFEWLFRLMTEPRRLWKRYLVNNPKFLFFLLLDALHLKRF